MLLIELLELTTYPDMVNRLQSVYNLIKGGDTAGEQFAAKAAYDRIMAAIKQDYGSAQAKKAEAKVKGGASSTRSSGSRAKSSTRRSSTRQKTKAKTGSTRQNYGNQRSSGKKEYTDSRGYTFYVVRFTDSSAGKRGSNKIWGYVDRGTGVYTTFRAAHGKKFGGTKDLHSWAEVEKLYQSKLNKGYRTVDLPNNLAVYQYIFDQI